MPIIQRLGSASARGFGFGKTGVTYQRAVQESASISDITSRIVSYDSIVAETSTATDAIANLLISLNQVLEAATGSDVIAGDRGFLNTVNETATISDLISTISNQTVITAETTTATDAVTNIGLFNRSVTETASTTDVPQGMILTTNNIVEAGTASDVITPGRTTSGVISEVALGLDETGRLVLANRVINETASGADVTAVSVSPSYWLSAFYGATVSDFQYLLSVYVDADENIYATGMGAGNGASNAVNVLKYDKDGALQWQRKLDTTYTDRGYAITTDSSGNVFVAGGYDDSGNTAPPGGVRGFIVKLNSSGTIQWQNLFWPSTNQQSNLSTRVYAITLDSSGNIYTTGLTNFSSGCLFVAKHDSAGNLQWFNSFYSGVPGTVGYSIKINSAGNLVVGGVYAYGASFTYVTPLILVLNTSGNLLSSVKMQSSSSSGTQDAQFYSIALDSNDNIYATGINGTNSSSTAYGPIICKFNSSLSLLWTKYLTPSFVSTNFPSYGVTVDSLGNPYLSYYDLYTASGQSVKMVKFDSSGTVQWANKISTVGGINYTGSGVPSNNLTNSLTSLIQVYVGVASSNAYGALAKVPLNGTRTGSYTVGPYGQPTTYASYTQTITAQNWLTETPTFTQLSPVMTTQTAGFTNYVTTQSSTTVFI